MRQAMPQRSPRCWPGFLLEEAPVVAMAAVRAPAVLLSIWQDCCRHPIFQSLFSPPVGGGTSHTRCWSLD